MIRISEAAKTYLRTEGSAGMNTSTTARILLGKKRIASDRQRGNDNRNAQISRFIDAIWSHNGEPPPPMPLFSAKFLADLEKVYGGEQPGLE